MIDRFINITHTIIIITSSSKFLITKIVIKTSDNENCHPNVRTNTVVKTFQLLQALFGASVLHAAAARVRRSTTHFVHYLRDNENC